MQKNISLRLSPQESTDKKKIIKAISVATGMPLSAISGFNILKRSIDARRGQVHIQLQLQIFVDEPSIPTPGFDFRFLDVGNSRYSVIIIGGGPAGIFAALQLLELGIKPIILERGKEVRARRRDLALLSREGILNEESNYCFGEGGAGTYSDGKLYTRSSKRGDVNRILRLFVHFGAEENILYDAHPHIGTNKLPHIITSMRKRIIDCGGEFHFQKKVTGFEINKNNLQSVHTADGDYFKGDAFILATGHSARDIFHLLHENNLEIQAKPFALGVRVEHSQHLINSIQYGNNYSAANVVDEDFILPPASYSLVQQIADRGVFSFCMCPGGIIAPASTSANELVVNGWSPSKRNNPFANSGVVVQTQPEDVVQFFKKKNKAVDMNSPLLMLQFQEEIEQMAFTAGGGSFVAPAQRMEDFVNKKVSSSLPVCSYNPGVHSTNLSSVLPSFINDRLTNAFQSFGKKLKGYFTNDAIVVATESRTSSPVRVPRDALTFKHPQLQNLYPCGEGAGYAGGIISAAMDGERVAKAAAMFSCNNSIHPHDRII